MSLIDDLWRSGAGSLAKSMAQKMDSGKRSVSDIVRSIRRDYRNPDGSSIDYEVARNVARRAFRAVDAGSRLDDQREKSIPDSRLPIDASLRGESSAKYSYSAVVEMTDPDTGESRRRLVRVLSSRRLTGDEIISQAQDTMIEERGYYGPGEQGPTNRWELSYSRIVAAGRKQAE